MKGYVLVEGHGETLAASNLIARLSAELDVFVPWSSPLRWKNLHLPRGVLRGAEFVRSKGDAGALLILRDEDDACPRDLAPQQARLLADLALPFPVAYVLLHPEYEVLFLPCLDRMTDLGFSASARWDGATWEARRGVKEWLTKQLPRGRSYKPTVQQLEMTRRIDLAAVRAAEVPCFGSLERGLRLLGERFGQGGGVYPEVGPAEL